MTSPLENKLNASMQSPRSRSTAASKAPAAAKSETGTTTSSATAKKTSSKPSNEAVVDLNAGGGRELNPQRIWPD